MAINRSKIARQLLAAGGVSFESPRRQGYLIGGLSAIPTEGIRVSGGRIVPSIQDPGSGKFDLLNEDGVPTAISKDQAEMMLGYSDPNELMSFTGSSYENEYTPEELKLLRTIPVSDYNTQGGGPITQRVRNQIATMRGDPLPYPLTTPTTATPTAEPEPERTGVGSLGSIIRKAIARREVQPTESIPSAPTFRLDDPAPIRNISDVFRIAGISDQGIGSIGMDQSYEENQAINEQRRLANQRFRSAASDLLARGDSITNEDVFRFGDRLGVSPEITSKVISGVQSMGLPAALPPPGGLKLEDIDQFGFPRPITQDDIDTYNFIPPGNDPGSFPGGVTLDGRTFQNERDAIAGLGIERYNELMATGGRVNLKGGGVSLDTAKKMAPKGEFLAYINPKEAKMLRDAGGSGIMTPMGIPSFVDFGPGGPSNPGPSGFGGGGNQNNNDDFSNGDDYEDDVARVEAYMNINQPPPTTPGEEEDLKALSYVNFNRPTQTPSRTGIFGSGIGGTDLFLAAFAPQIFAIKKTADILGFSDPNAKFKGPPRSEDDNNDNQIVKPIMPIIPKKPTDIVEEQSDFVQRFILPEPYRLRAADGGLASLQPRQELFLGGVADAVGGAVKGVTGAVKKIVKSDLGKAALTAAAMYYAPGFGIKAQGGFAPFFSNMGSFFSGGLDSIPGGGVTATILGASLLGGLLTSKQPEQDIDALSNRISDQTGIDVAKIRAEVQQAYRDKDTSKLAKKYPFLVPEESALSYDYEKGGRVGFKNGTKEKVVKEVEKEKPMTPEEYFQGKKKFNKKKMLEDMEDEYREYLDRQKYGPRNEAAGGGIMSQEEGMMNLGGNEMDLRGGGFVPIGAKEKADDVPARLSKNEFVFTADAVRAAGGGSVDRGADLMYKTMKQLENKVV